MRERRAAEADRIVRTICLFAQDPGPGAAEKLRHLRLKLSEAGFQTQTLRVCSPGSDPEGLVRAVADQEVLLSLGTVDFAAAQRLHPAFCRSDRVSYNLDLSSGPITVEHARLLFQLIDSCPSNSFLFAYTFNDPPSSPYFPSAQFQQDGFSVGLQATNLAAGAQTLDQWLDAMEAAWHELDLLLGGEPGFLGIDSSVAPLYRGDSSLVNLVRRLHGDFDRSCTTDTYLRITQALRRRNPRPLGLCGLMLPCLEDFELAEEYQAGRFSLERNLFLSLHCGLGIDTYPIGIDEAPERVTEVLRLVQGLSQRHAKPLSVRFVSDGKARIGQRTDFRNQYLADVVVRPL